MNLSDVEKSRIEIAGMLHDIGMIGVPEDILNKSEKLTDEEWIEEYKKIEPERRIQWYEDITYKLKEHYKYSKPDIPEDEYIANYIIFFKSSISLAVNFLYSPIGKLPNFILSIRILFNLVTL